MAVEVLRATVAVDLVCLECGHEFFDDFEEESLASVASRDFGCPKCIESAIDQYDEDRDQRDMPRR